MHGTLIHLGILFFCLPMFIYVIAYSLGSQFGSLSIKPVHLIGEKPKLKSVLSARVTDDHSQRPGAHASQPLTLTFHRKKNFHP